MHWRFKWSLTSEPESGDILQIWKSVQSGLLAFKVPESIFAFFESSCFPLVDGAGSASAAFKDNGNSRPDSAHIGFGALYEKNSGTFISSCGQKEREIRPAYGCRFRNGSQKFHIPIGAMKCDNPIAMSRQCFTQIPRQFNLERTKGFRLIAYGMLRLSISVDSADFSLKDGEYSGTSWIPVNNCLH